MGRSGAGSQMPFDQTRGAGIFGRARSAAAPAAGAAPSATADLLSVDAVAAAGAAAAAGADSLRACAAAARSSVRHSVVGSRAATRAHVPFRIRRFLIALPFTRITPFAWKIV